MPVPVVNGFIGTLSDDDDVPDYDMEAPSIQPKQPKSMKKQATKPPKDATFNPDFAFDAEGGSGPLHARHAWDFTFAKSTITEQQKVCLC